MTKSERRKPTTKPRGRANSSRPEATSTAERLQKVLAQWGLGSRREAEQWIRAGRLTVNGQLATLGVRVLASDQLRLDGRIVRPRAGSSVGVFLCHRSAGQTLGQPNEGARPGRRFIAISPMPRIDGGLELLTCDGELAGRLQRAVHGMTSEFSVRVRGELTEPQRLCILEGVLDRGARLTVERCEAAGGEGSNRWYGLTARGGSGKDVRQLFERHGALVSRVLRTHLGPLTLERRLARGRFRELAEEELQALTAAALGTRSSVP